MENEKVCFDELEVRKARARGYLVQETAERLIDKINATRFYIQQDINLQGEEESVIDCDLVLEYLERIYILAAKLDGLITECEPIILGDEK